jgi:WG containing repeat
MKNLLFIIVFFYTATASFAQDLLIPYRKGNLWGYANEEGKIVVEPKYSKTYLFGEDKYKYLINKNIKNETLIGLIKKSGEVIVEPKYNYVYEVEVATFIKNYNSNTFGDVAYYNYERYKKKGEKLIENYFLTSNKEAGGVQEYRDSTGKILMNNIEVLEITKKYGEGFFNFSYKQNNLIGVADYKAKIILLPKYESIEFVREINKADYYIVTEKGKTGLITATGKVIIPFAIQVIKKVKFPATEELLLKVFKNKQSAIFNASGKKLIGFTSKYIEINVTTKNSKEQITFELRDDENKNGTIQDETSEKSYDMPDKRYADMPPERNIIYFRSLNNKNIEIYKKEELYGLRYTDDSVIIIQPKYEKLVWCMDVSFQRNNGYNFMYVTTKNGIGIIDTENKIIIPTIYKDVYPSMYNNTYETFNSLYIVTKKDNTKGVLNNKNEKVVPFNYTSITDALYGKTDSTWNFLVKNKNNLLGIINNKNKTIIPEAYSHLEYASYLNQNFTKYYFIAKPFGKGYGIIDLNNTIILPTKYDSLINTYLNFRNTDYNYPKPITTHYFYVKENNQYSYVRSNGDYIIPPQNNPLRNLLNAYENETEYYAITESYLKENKMVYNYELISSKRGILIPGDSAYYYNDINTINDYKKGIVQIENVRRLQGIAFINKGKIINPIYYRISKSYLLKNNKKNIQYYELEYRPDYGEGYIDIVNENGLQFFEN